MQFKKMIKCPNCHKEMAKINLVLGVLPCGKCQLKDLKRALKQVEMVGEDIKEQRKAYAKDIRPAHRKGRLDKGFVERYGKQKAREQGFSDDEIEKAEHEWSKDEDYYFEG